VPIRFQRILGSSTNRERYVYVKLPITLASPGERFMVTQQNILLALPVLTPLAASNPDESLTVCPPDCFSNEGIFTAPIDEEDEEDDDPEEEEDDLDEEEEEEDDEDDYEDDEDVEDDDDGVIIEDDEAEDELDDDEEEDEVDDEEEEDEDSVRPRRMMSVNTPRPSRHSQAVRPQ
jgi:hypothetical protein